MRVDGLEIESFGPWQDLSVTGFSHQLTLLVVADQSAEAALVQFLRFVLFGDRGHETAPETTTSGCGGPAAGSLLVTTPEGPCRIRRSYDRSMASPKSEELTIGSHTGPRQPIEQIDAMLRGIDGESFREYFNLRDSDIARASSAGESELFQRCLELAQSHGDAAHAVEQLGSDLALPQLDGDGGLARLAELGERRKDQEQALRGQADLRRAHARAIAQHHKLSQTIERARQRIASIGRRLRWLGRLQRLHAKQSRLAEIERSLATADRARATAQARLAADESLSPRDARIDRCRRCIGQLRRMRRELMGQIRGLAFAAVHASARRARSLLDESDRLRQREARIARAESCERPLVGHNDILAQPPGGHDATHREVPSADSETLWKSVAPAAEVLRAAVMTFRHSRDNCVRALETIRPREHTSPRPVDQALHDATNRVSQFRRLVPLEEQIGRMQSRRQGLQAECQRLMREQTLPPWAVGMLGGFFAVGAAAVLGGTVLAETGTKWWLVLIGLTGCLAVGLIRMSYLRLASDRLTSTGGQMQVLSAQIDQAQSQREAIDVALGTRGQPPGEALERAEAELAALRSTAAVHEPSDYPIGPIGPMGLRSTATVHEPSSDPSTDDARRERLGQATRELAAARRQWHDALASAGLPTELSPRGAHALLAKRRALERRKQSHREALAAWVAACRELLGQLGVEVVGQSVSELAGQLREVLLEQRQLGARRKTLVDRFRQLRQREQRVRRSAKRLAAHRRELAGTHAAAAANVSPDDPMLALQGDTLQRDIEAATNRAKSNPRVAPWLEKNLDELSELRRQYLAQRDDLRKQLETDLEKRGRWQERLKQLAKDRRLAEWQLERSATNDQIGHEAARWHTAKAGKLFLQQSMAARRMRLCMEKMLPYASGYLADLTEGRLRRLRADFVRRRFRIDDCSGSWRCWEDLETGDRQSVYLCLRLAQVHRLADQSIRLPLVVEWAMPESDPDRATLMSRGLVHFAQDGHQVVLLSTHDSDLLLFQHRGVRVAELDVQGDAPLRLVLQDGETVKPARDHVPDSARGDRLPVSRLPSAKGDEDEAYEVFGPVALDRAGESLRRITLGSLASAGQTETSDAIRPGHWPDSRSAADISHDSSDGQLSSSASDQVASSQDSDVKAPARTQRDGAQDQPPEWWPD